VQNLDEDLRDGGVVLEVLMRLDQERSAREQIAVPSVIEYKKRPKSEKFKLHNWELVQQLLDSPLEARALVAGDTTLMHALVEQLVQRSLTHTARDLRGTLVDILTQHSALDAAINSAAVSLSQGWQISYVLYFDTCQHVTNLLFIVHLQTRWCGSSCCIIGHVISSEISHP